jgi:CSLREA domain-containing protein
VVNSTADPGSGTCDASECTLREAIAAANAAPGADSIHFSIPGPGPHTIQPTSALPTITDPVTIDGTTEPDFAGAPIVEISGALAPIEVAGLKITAGSSTVRGLVINGFIHGTLNINSPDGEGIVLESGDGNVIEGNYLGTDVSGTLDLGNHTGIRVSSFSMNNTIGGATSAERNLISGNNRFGIYSVGSATSGNLIEGNYIGVDVSGASAVPNLSGVNFNFGDGNAVRRNVISGNAGGAVIIGAGSNNVVQGNMIGTDSTGTAAIPNGFGVQILGGNSPSFPASNNLIGGTGPGEGNVISGNTSLSVLLNSFSASNGSTGNRIEGNRIGVGTNGADLGNGTGVSIGSVGGMNNTIIGGTAPGAGNIIAYNDTPGVGVSSGNTGEQILGNSIHSNTGLGIDLDAAGVTPNDDDDADTGPNDLQNFPLLTGATSGSGSTITGSLNSTPATTFRLEFFANSACDASGNGEGELYLGAESVTTDGGGDVAFSSSVPTSIPSGWVVTATATNPAGSTSEFSACTESEDAAATLIVIKHVINDNGGTAEADDFTLDSGGADDTPDDFPGAEAPGTSVTMSPGSYNVTETGPSGYTASFLADCSGSIAAGETKTCTVTNDDIPVDSQITPAAATCAEFNAGTSVTLSQVNYTVANGKIHQVDPGAFYYWVKVPAVAGSNTFTINQAITTGNFDSHFFNQAAAQVYSPNCVKVRNAVISTSAGVTTVTFSAASAGTYIIGIKYNAWSVKSFTAPSPTTVHYTFQLDALATSLKGLDLVKFP